MRGSAPILGQACSEQAITCHSSGFTADLDVVAPRLEAFFLPLEHGGRFCLLHRPPEKAPVHGAVLFIHPFAEEMNRCRRMAALQSRAFANAGWIVLQIDLYGCGDSAGDFGEATWANWLDDVLQAFAWLRANTGYQPIVWGLRAGCLLAVQAAEQAERAPDLVLWQPPSSGKQVLQQFLRLQIANQMLGPAGIERASTEQLRQRLMHGETIEVAGYALSPGLALGLEAAQLKLPIPSGRTAWFEISGEAGGGFSPAARMRIESWQRATHTVEARVVHGAAFWQTVEVSECRALIQATLEVVETWRR